MSCGLATRNKSLKDEFPKEINMMISIIKGTFDEEQRKPEAVLLQMELNPLVDVIGDLLRDRSKISIAHASILGSSSKLMVKRIKKSPQKNEIMKELNDDTPFDGTIVKSIGDLPKEWLWGVLLEITQEVCGEDGLPDETIASMSAKSEKPMRTSLHYLSRLDSKFPVRGALLVKKKLKQFIKDLILEQGLLGLHGGFFRTGIESGECLFNRRLHGIYTFVGKPNEKAIGVYIAHKGITKLFADADKNTIELNREIFDNDHEFGAYIMVMGSKSPVFKMIYKEKKKTLEDKAHQALVSKANRFENQQEAEASMVSQSLVGLTKRRGRTPSSAPGAMQIPLSPP